MDKQYYIDKHLKLYDECLIEAGAENAVDVTAGADMLYEDYASAEHIVGYYLHNYKDAALKEWEKNLSYAKDRWGETEQDKEVTKNLKELFPEQTKESDMLKNIIEYSSDIYSKKLHVWCNALIGEFWNPVKQDYITKEELPGPLLHAYENLCDFTGDDYLVDYENKFYYMIDHVYNERLAGDLNIHSNEGLYAVALENAKTISRYDELKDTVILVSKGFSSFSGGISNDNHYVSILIDPYTPKEIVDKINKISSEHMFKLPEKEQKNGIKAVNIEWDVDYKEDLEGLPTEIEIPAGIEDEDKISDYISEITGFCHKGFELINYNNNNLDIKPSLTAQIQSASSRANKSTSSVKETIEPQL